MPMVLVRNTKAGPTVFTDHAKNIAIEWSGTGDPAGNDLQYVPDEVVIESADFNKHLRRGTFEVVKASPEAEAHLARQVEADNERKAAAAAAVEAQIDRSVHRPIATAAVDEQGGLTIYGEAEADPETGELVQGSLPVIIEPLRRG